MSDNFIKVNVVDRKGHKHEPEGPTDMNMNLMELLKAHELPVLGTCGGMALCSTCHCYLLSAHDLPEQSDQELDILDQAFSVKQNSRLACQIYLASYLDGLTIQLAPDGESE